MASSEWIHLSLRGVLEFFNDMGSSMRPKQSRMCPDEKGCCGEKLEDEQFCKDDIAA